MRERIDPNRLALACASALRAHGVGANESHNIADVLLDADCSGVPTHGLALLPGLCEGIANGRVRPGRRLIKRRHGSTYISARNDIGVTVGLESIALLEEIVSEIGHGVVIASDFSHWGRAGYYTRALAERGILAISVLRTASVMSLGGRHPLRVGNNVISAAIPASTPVVLDVTLSDRSVGALHAMFRAGVTTSEVPSGYDLSGRLTHVIQDILNGGTVMPVGGHRGYAMSLAIEALMAYAGLRPPARLPIQETTSGRGTRADNSAILFGFKVPDTLKSSDGMEKWFHSINGSLSEFAAFVPGHRSNANRLRSQRDKVILTTEVIQMLLGSTQTARFFHDLRLPPDPSDEDASGSRNR